MNNNVLLIRLACFNALLVVSIYSFDFVKVWIIARIENQQKRFVRMVTYKMEYVHINHFKTNNSNREMNVVDLERYDDFF